MALLHLPFRQEVKSMAIGKIDGINPIPNIYTNTFPRTPHPGSEKPAITPPGKTEETVIPKNITKVKDPPFLPIGDTWSIFDK